MRLLSILAALSVVGCSHAFSRIQPGMNSTEVRGTTGATAPTNVVPWPDGSQSWFYAGNRCILIVNDKVVAKYSPDDAPTGTTDAVCAPPGARAAPAEAAPAETAQ